MSAAGPRRRRRARLPFLVLLLAVAGVAAFAVAGPGGKLSEGVKAGTKAKNTAIGVSYGGRLVDMKREQLATALDDAAALGATWIRDDLAWNKVQPDRKSGWDWLGFDAVVDAASERGLHVLPLLAYSPAWARDPGCESSICPPRDPAEFATFAAEAAERYAPYGIHVWEIWHEPNRGDYWVTPDPERYATVLNTAAQAIKAADPEATVILGGMSSTPSKRTIQPREFLERVCRKGGCDAIDAVGFHPTTTPALASTKPPAETAWNLMTRNKNSLREILDRRGYKHLEFWVTSFRASTGGPGNASDGSADQLWPYPSDHVTEAHQARIAADAVASAAADPHVAAFFWFCSRDQAGGTDPAHFCGLRRADGTPKPAWAAFKKAAATVRQ